MNGVSNAERGLSVETWRALAQAGQPAPMRFFVTGDSMVPFIRGGKDELTLVPMDRPPRIGDVVLFPHGSLPRRYVLHRVWKIEGDRVQTFGDGCMKPDGWMGMDRVWGRVVGIRRNGRFLNPDNRWLRVAETLWVRTWRVRRWLLWIFLPERAVAAIGRRLPVKWRLMI